MAFRCWETPICEGRRPLRVVMGVSMGDPELGLSMVPSLVGLPRGTGGS